MLHIETADAAERRASQAMGQVADLEPVTDDAGTVHGWTFRVVGGKLRHGWVLTDGRVSPATETYRAGAEAYALGTLGLA